MKWYVVAVMAVLALWLVSIIFTVLINAMFGRMK
jgi:hypothetical protein